MTFHSYFFFLSTSKEEECLATPHPGNRKMLKSKKTMEDVFQLQETENPRKWLKQNVVVKISNGSSERPLYSHPFVL